MFLGTARDRQRMVMVDGKERKVILGLNKFSDHP